MPVGLELASEVRAMRPKLPWFCIGGVNLKTIESVAEAGAERIVAVSDVLKPEDTASAVRELTQKFLHHKTV
ncbi:MAG: thiamine phosphate synthase [Opitutales bacterium]|nr:thiamine phosphate synthase [Opitutales bacterium]